MIDDAAVTPKYVHGFEANRELPIIWRITKGSLRNKLVFLLPAGLLLSNFAPWVIAPLLMLGGAYLCFEGAEKVAHALGLSQGTPDTPARPRSRSRASGRAKGHGRHQDRLHPVCRNHDHCAGRDPTQQLLDGGRDAGCGGGYDHRRGLWCGRADREDGRPGSRDGEPRRLRPPAHWGADWSRGCPAFLC